MMRYFAKPDTWFDAGSEAFLIGGSGPWTETPEFGLFCGLRDGSEDEEVCRLDEFDLREE